MFIIYKACGCSEQHVFGQAPILKVFKLCIEIPENDGNVAHSQKHVTTGLRPIKGPEHKQGHHIHLRLLR